MARCLLVLHVVALTILSALRSHRQHEMAQELAMRAANGIDEAMYVRRWRLKRSASCRPLAAQRPPASNS
jgi:hypothetical protein